MRLCVAERYTYRSGLGIVPSHCNQNREGRENDRCAASESDLRFFQQFAFSFVFEKARKLGVLGLQIISSEQKFENIASKNHTYPHSLPSQHTYAHPVVLASPMRSAIAQVCKQ